jgi:hypothetical protein
MKLKLFITLFFAVITSSFAQQLTYKNGRVFNSDNRKISPSEVRELLKDNPEQLDQFNSGRTKAGIGGFLLGFGGGLILADVIGGATADRIYPGTATYIGVACAVISIPVLIGHNKKIKSSIEGYNSSLAKNSTSFNIEKINILSNKNGIGMQISF